MLRMLNVLHWENEFYSTFAEIQVNESVGNYLKIFLFKDLFIRSFIKEAILCG